MLKLDSRVPKLRASASTELKRRLWEAVETYLEKILQQSEPVEPVTLFLISALLNAHETSIPATVTRIETLLAQLALAAPLNNRANVEKLDAFPPWRDTAPQPME